MKEICPQREATLPTPWFWTSSLQNCEAIHFFCFKPPSAHIQCKAESSERDFSQRRQKGPGWLWVLQKCSWLAWTPGAGQQRGSSLCRKQVPYNLTMTSFLSSLLLRLLLPWIPSVDCVQDGPPLVSPSWNPLFVTFTTFIFQFLIITFYLFTCLLVDFPN